MLLEQGQLSCGTTWHAAGLVGQLRASESGTRLVQYSTQLYAELEAETGLSAGYKQCGGVTVARTEDRMIQLRRTAANAAAFDLECELLSPEQALEHYPVMRVDDLVGAIWLPADGKANPTDLTFALAKGARMRGARIVEKARVTGVLTHGRPGHRGAHRRRRHRGRDRRQLRRASGPSRSARWQGVNVPLHSAEHFYVVTEAIDGVHPDLPILRDPDGYTYFKEEVGGLVIGGFEPEAKPWVSPDDDPVSVRVPAARGGLGPLRGPDGQRPAADPRARADRYQEVLQRAGELHPGQPVHPRRGARARRTSSSARDSTRSASPPQAARAARSRSGSSTVHPTSDLTGVDIRRFAPFNGNNRWLHDRVAEILGLHYEIPWPNREMTTARPFRRSPVHHLLEAANANFGSRMGWERANFFAPAGVDPAIEYSWGKPNWLPWSAAEQVNTRTGVTVFDQTSFSKYLLVGPDAEAALQWLCTADVGSRRSARPVYTGMLNERGTYESDVTVTRTGADEYLIVSSAATTERDKDHIRRNLPAGARASLVDVTSSLRGIRRDGAEVARPAGDADHRRPVR